MEQQNQQSNQQLDQTFIDEQKRKMSKRMKISLLALASIVLVVGGILLFVSLRSKSLGINPITYVQCSQLEQEIDTLIQQANYCEVDEDCVVSPEAAHPGLCWNLVNKDADAASIQEKKLRWENLDCNKGRVYEQCAQAPQILKCQENRCVGIQQQEDSIIDTSTWQTYRNEEFGFEVKYPLFFKPTEEDKKFLITGTSFSYENSPERFRVEVVEKSLEEVEYVAQDGILADSIYRFSRSKDEWYYVSTVWGESRPEDHLNFVHEGAVPKKYSVEGGLSTWVGYANNTHHAGEEKSLHTAYIKSPTKKFTVIVSLYRCRTSVSGPSEGCKTFPEEFLTDSSTMFKILSTFRFVE